MKATTSTSINLHFNIHDYKERLTPSKKGKFHCPVCNDPNFSIDKKGPGYACYKGGCDAKDIREAIRPAAEVKQLLEADRERKRKTPVPYSLSVTHLKEMALSGIPEGLARMNIRSVEDAHQIAEFLNWQGYMGSIGWLYTGVDPETGFDTGIGQFKPDEKFAFPNGNLAKYLSQKHAYDATCFRVLCWVMRKVSTRYGVPMPEGMAVINDSDEVTTVFWRWVIDNPQLPISPAEGGKKALLLLAEGRIGISISGVDMATIGRGVDLVPSLKKLAVKGRPVEPFYDADIIEKPDVENALMAFGAALTRAGCVITVPTWDLELGKGVDDLAVNEGEGWENSLTVLSYKDWLKKLEQRRQELKKRSPVKKNKKQAQDQQTGGVDVPANLKVLQIEPTDHPAGQQFNAILQILGKTPINEPVAPLVFGTEEDAEFARQYSIGSIAVPADEESIQQTIGQLQNAGCRAISYLADGNNETEQLLLAMCERLQVACAVIDSEVLYPDTEKGNIRQILTTMSTEDFIRRIEDELHLRAEQDKEHRQSLAKGDDDDKVKAPKEKGVTPQIIGDELAEDLRDQLLYSSSHKSWMKYSLEFPGVWTQVPEDYVRHIVHNLCRARGVMPNNNFIKNVLGWLQRTLFEFKWLERPSNELLPFEDGILNLLTNEWHEHAPGFRLTWVLPRKYQGSAVHAGWKRIEIWLDQATRGNKRMKDELLAFCAATLRGMSGLQKFLIGTGYGGTGKGTYTQLVTLLVGEQNVWVGKLEDLTKQDKIAELQTKRLAIFDDQEKYTGNLSNFRSMTGGALINGRNLYERSVTFRFPGLALITANQPCFPASALSWLKRRIIQHEFAYTPTKRNRNLVREFEPEISAFTKYLLSIPVSEIERILDPEDQSINGTFWEDRVRADPMAAWLNELVIHDADAKTGVGSDKNEWKDATYVPAQSTLFGSYNHYCTGGGYSAKGKNNFSADLVELCREVLGWKDVSKERAAVGVVIKGLRLRTDTDKGIATVEELLEQKNVDLGLHCVDLNVDLEPLPHKDYVDHVDLTSRIAEKNENTSADSNLILGAGTDSASLDQVTITADAIETLPSPKVYTVYTSDTEQDIQPSQGLHSGLHSGQHEPELEPPPTYSGAAEQVLIAPPELETAPTVPTPPTVPPITPSTGSSQSNLLLLQDYARRIGEALGYQSPATAKAIAEYIQESIVNQDITESELAEVAGIENWQAFTALRNLTENEKNLVEIVQQAIASNDAETAKSVLSSLKEVCNSGAADRQKVWNSGLTESEREAFSALLQ
jgi:putative DNA primase/helicase